MFLVYNSGELVLEGYSDVSFQSHVDDAKSQSSFVFKLNSGVVAWKSSKQDTTTDSTIDAEYIVASGAAMELVCMKNYIQEGAYHRLGRGCRQSTWTSACIEMMMSSASEPCLLKYLKRIKDMFLIYSGGELILEGYSNASFQSDDDDAKAQSGFVFKLNGGMVAWKSSKQESSTTDPPQ
ncbi:UNVERIFIED_CONTAM: Secreted RxLR effector protein [Sesamum angustifolium]|uniref:Secreted RxLR effector protein n=1 Tax=Sesamum angustifolium TaxID=2727405 RepID=A0AAW2JTQ5_9LAMI